jgi:ABC-type dipeptide/oligopeptide/nickel transport system permease component
MGILFLDGVKTRDYPLIMGMVLVAALTIVVSNLITDLTYGSIDPRIRYD